jgi:hypothetical protein
LQHSVLLSLAQSDVAVQTWSFSVAVQDGVMLVVHFPQ